MSNKDILQFTQKPVVTVATTAAKLLGNAGGLKSNIFHDDYLRLNSKLNATTTTTPAWVRQVVNTPNKSIPIPDVVITEPICQAILYDDIGDSMVRVWDLIILIPNAVFLIFLLWKSRYAIGKLHSTNSPIFTAFSVLVSVVAVISVLRCIVSMTVNASVLAGDIADKILWLVLRFFLLSTELSIVIFGLAFGHLDSKKSIQMVLLVTSCIGLVYSCTQGTLEFIYPDPQFHVSKDTNSTVQDFDIFGHGGMIFWLTSSLFFFLIYTSISILPWTNLREKMSLPPKKSFYMYCAFLALLNLAQAVGSGLLYGAILEGMCVVDVTTYVYFTCFAPLVYLVFLRKFFRVTQPGILFSYKNQVDEVAEEDTVSLPYQSGSAAAKPDNEAEGFHGSYDSTHFDRQNSLDYSRQSNLLNGSINSSDIDVEVSVNSDYYQASA